jgi:hypothetical protein
MFLLQKEHAPVFCFHHIAPLYSGLSYEQFNNYNQVFVG